MPTNLAIDDRLLEEARAIGQHKTKKETVAAALREYINRRKQRMVISSFGTVEFDSAYDYKKERQKS